MISAPSSTKNRTGTRAPAMHQTKRGKNWYFGMKGHMGADRDSGLVVCTVTSVNDVTVGNALLHGEEFDVSADADHRGADKRADAAAARRRLAMRPIDWRRWKRRPRIGPLIDYVERDKASSQAKVDHPFRVLRRQFGHSGLQHADT